MSLSIYMSFPSYWVKPLLKVLLNSKTQELTVDLCMQPIRGKYTNTKISILVTLCKKSCVSRSTVIRYADWYGLFLFVMDVKSERLGI